MFILPESSSVLSHIFHWSPTLGDPAEEGRNAGATREVERCILYPKITAEARK